MQPSVIDPFQRAYFLNRSTEATLNLKANDIVCRVLSLIGIHDQMHAWFIFYLSYRLSSVRIGKSLSIDFDINRGCCFSTRAITLHYLYYTHLIYILSKYPYIKYHIYILTFTFIGLRTALCVNNRL